MLYFTTQIKRNIAQLCATHDQANPDFQADNDPFLSHIYCTYITVQLSRQANALLSTISKTAKATAKANGL